MASVSFDVEHKGKRRQGGLHVFVLFLNHFEGGVTTHRKIHIFSVSTTGVLIHASGHVTATSTTTASSPSTACDSHPSALRLRGCAFSTAPSTRPRSLAASSSSLHWASAGLRAVCSSRLLSRILLIGRPTCVFLTASGRASGFPAFADSA